MRDRFAWPVLLTLVLLPLLFYTALWYAQDRGIPSDVALATLPAFLLEAGLYVASGLRVVRERLERLRPQTLATLLTAVAPVSWLLLVLPRGRFEITELAALLGMAAVTSFWYVAVPRRTWSDLLFLVIMAAPVLSGVFDRLYPDPAQRLPGQILGLFMWYRTLLVTLLCIRRIQGVNFGFIPAARDWVIGLRNFAWFLPAGLAIAFGIGFVRFRHVAWDGRMLVIVILTFAGVLWVLAVAEEFFFRGVLQQQLALILGSQRAGLIGASLIFGAAHLAYPPAPNYRFAFLAAVAGFFYGRAYLQAHSIRAAMVTHALVVTTWKIFLV